MRNSRSPCQSMPTRTPSIGNGWQNGIRSEVRLTAMVPAMTAVSTMPPLALFNPLARSCAATAAGNFTRHSATASRAVTALSETSTIAGRPLASMWLSLRAGFGVIAVESRDRHGDCRPWREPARARPPGEPGGENLSPDQEHLHVPARCPCAPAQFAVAITARGPQACDMFGQSGIAIAQPRPQIGAFAGEQAGVQPAVGGDARAVAVAAERGADRADEADLAGAVVEAVARGHLAPVVGTERVQRPARVDKVAQPRRRHDAGG